jgi:hypothetical protein
VSIDAFPDKNFETKGTLVRLQLLLLWAGFRGRFSHGNFSLTLRIIFVTTGPIGLTGDRCLVFAGSAPIGAAAGRGLGRFLGGCIIVTSFTA